MPLRQRSSALSILAPDAGANGVESVDQFHCVLLQRRCRQLRRQCAACGCRSTIDCCQRNRFASSRAGAGDPIRRRYWRFVRYPDGDHRGSWTRRRRPRRNRIHGTGAGTRDRTGCWMSTSKSRRVRSCYPPASLAMPLRLQSSNPRRLRLLVKAQRTARRQLKRNRCQVPWTAFDPPGEDNGARVRGNDAALCGKRREPRSRRFPLYRLFVFLRHSNVNSLRLRVQDNKVDRAARRLRGNVMQKMLSDLGLYMKRTRGAGFFTTLAVFRRHDRDGGGSRRGTSKTPQPTRLTWRR